MQAIILAAGNSTRFDFFTTLSHKSLISLMGKPLILHTVLSIKKAGITDIIIVEDESGDIKSSLGNGSIYGVSIVYVTHTDAKGAGQALLDAKDHIKGDFFLVYPYHVNFSDFAKLLLEKKQEKNDIVLLGRKETNVEEYGSVDYIGDRVVSLIEKQKIDTESSVRVVGMYLLHIPFLDVLSSVEKEHYSLEKALDSYAKMQTARIVLTTQETMSLKYPWNLLHIKNFLLKTSVPFISPNATIAESACISDDSYIDEGAVIMEGACIKGKSYIGRNVRIGNNAIVRNDGCIEEGTVIGANMEVKNSVILEKSTTHSGFIGDSVIGRACKIAAYFCTGNVRLDREAIVIALKEKRITTQFHSLGVIMGDKAKIGIRVSTMPGILIGKNSVVGPGTTVMNSIDPDRVYYTKFQEIVEKKK